MGASGGGGGSSGAVSHAAYLETIHADWLNDSGADTIGTSVTASMAAAIGSSPWTTLTAYDPSADITAYEVVLTAYKAILSGVVDTTSWAALYAQAVLTINGAADAEIAVDAGAYADVLDDEIANKVLPRFRRGMQDINAVVSSAFVIGAAVIEGFRDRDVAKYTSSLRFKNKDLILAGTEQMLRLMIQRVGWEEGYARTFVEAKRIKIVAKKEQLDQDATIDEKDALWDLQVFQFGANVMASIQGGTAGSKQIPSVLQSVLGGAMSGAASGAMVGGAPGAMIGGVLGAAAGLLR